MFVEVNVKFSWVEDSKNGTKEKSFKESYLVKTDSIEVAQKRIHEMLSNTDGRDFEIESIRKTKYVKLIDMKPEN